jgi:hypothetical protein
MLKYRWSVKYWDSAGWHSRNSLNLYFEALGLIIEQDTGYHYWGLSWFSSVLLGKYQDSTSIKPWQRLPSRSFLIHNSWIILPFNTV